MRRGDRYKSEEARVDEQVDPNPDTPQGLLNNFNRLDRTETNPKLVERFYQIARLTEGGDSNLLTEGYQTPVLINSNFILYKISHTEGIGMDSVSTIDFVHIITGPSRLMKDDDEYVYSVPEDTFRDDLVEYINGVYLRTGLYLLMIGFFLQTLDILITEIAIGL